MPRSWKFFFEYPGFAIDVRRSFNILREFCVEHNKLKNKHKLRFRVYDTIPTMSMVMVDPKNKSGEIELEFFIYQAGEFRPRLSVKTTMSNDDLFGLLYEKFDQLWNHSRRIV